ncbi:spermidine synthase [Nocardia concava]|uniref:spermidine synthase n=1 Tax=Nocardia concava TaxID=257281 RepID=UPI0002D42871|nr:fused MFS/spermidine synthase [Nocardia concava]
MSNSSEAPCEEDAQSERTPGRVTREVRFGLAELAPDEDRAGGWFLRVNDIAQSYVDLNDPSHLELDYMRYLAYVLEAREPAAAPLDVVHIGGGAGTFPRYLAAVRPGSRQLVIEADEALAEFVDQHLGLRAVPGLDLRIGDGLSEIATLATDSMDVVVADAFEGLRMAPGITGAEFTAQVARVLRPDGIYLLNLIGTGAGSDAVRAVFPHRVLVDGDVFAGYVGNRVLAASRVPFRLDALNRIAGRAWPPTRVWPDEGSETLARTEG